MTDAEIAKAIRDKARALVAAIDAARREGLEVKVTINFDDVCGSGDDRGIRFFDGKVAVGRNF